MSNQESESQNPELQMMLAQAKDALVETNFDDAESKYRSALALSRQLFSEPHRETAACLVGLGDAFFAASRFDEAKNSYQESLIEFDGMQNIDAKDKIPALLRFAKTLTVLKEFALADKRFADTVAVAEPALPLGHPLLTSIYESYANMLAQAKLDPGTEREDYWREKAKVCREKFTPPKRPPLTNKPAQLSKMRMAQSSNLYMSSMGRNFLVILILAMVSVGAFVYMNAPIRSQIARYLGTQFHK